jgi:RND family efflux transporter MFP subunit
MNQETSINPVTENKPAPAKGRTQLLVLGATVLGIGAFLAAGIALRARGQERLATKASEDTRPIVAVTNVSRVNSGADILLPASVRAYEETTLYARANGYVKRWMVDIGDKVTAGQVLAEIDTPDLDQELNQARAALEQARANLDLARSTAERWVGLLTTHSVSEQEVDEKRGALAARQADFNAADAAVHRLVQLTDFKQVVAPFAGIVTRRNVDTGALIQAGGGANAKPLFSLAQIQTLRVMVDVPQAYMREVSLDQPVEVHVKEFAGRVFTGKVVRTAGALEPTTRTLLSEVQVDNRDGTLMPGIHADVRLELARSEPPIVVPAACVMTRAEGSIVAEVEGAGTIHLQKVELGRDLGASIEIVAGLPDHARIVLQPSDSLKEGAQVVPQGGQPGKDLAQLAEK